MKTSLGYTGDCIKNTKLKESILKPLLTISGPPTTPPPCIDKVNACENYGKEVCNNPDYAPWVLDNCRYFCRKCLRKYIFLLPWSRQLGVWMNRLIYSELLLIDGYFKRFSFCIRSSTNHADTAIL